MTHNETEILIQRYLEGETTREEELQLALEVSRDDAPEDWRLIAEMLSTLTVDEALYDEEMRRRNEAQTVVLKPKHTIRKSLKWVWTAAACLVATAITVPLVWNHHSAPDMVAYVYGEKITEQDAVLEIMASTMEDVFSNAPTDPVAELEGFFGE